MLIIKTDKRELLDSVELEGVVYNKYSLTDDKDSNGESKLQLEINIYDVNTDLTTLLSRYTDYVLSLDDTLEEFSIGISFSTALIKTQFSPIIPTDTSELEARALDISNETRYIFSFEGMAGTDELIDLEVECTDEKMIVEGFYPAKHYDSSGNVVDNFNSLVSASFKNCIFEDGVLVNRKDLVLQYIDCEIFNSVVCADDWKINSKNKLAIGFESCNFRDLQTIDISGANMVELRNIQVTHPTPKTEDNTLVAMNPRIVLSKIYDLIIDRFNITNFYAPLTISDCKYCKFTYFAAQYLDIKNPARETVVISDSENVTVSYFYCNGLRIHSCKMVSVADLIVESNVCQNADFGLMASGITSLLSVCTIDVKPNTVKLPVSISLCIGSVHISDINLKDQTSGVSVSSISNKVSISDCSFTNMKSYGIYCQRIVGRLNIVDTTIVTPKLSGIQINGCEDVSFDNVTVSGSPIDKTTKETPDILVETVESFKLTKSLFNNAGLNLKLCRHVKLDTIAFKTSWLDSNVSDEFEIKLSVFEGTPTIRSSTDSGSEEYYKHFRITSTKKLTLTENIFKMLVSPLIHSSDLFKITGNTFDDGLRIESSGIQNSTIKNNRFGTVDRERCVHFLSLTDCKHTSISENTFLNYDEAPNIMNIQDCNYLMIDTRGNEYADYATPKIEIGQASSNNCIVIEKSDPLAPILSDLRSSFKQFLYAYNVGVFNKKYSNMSGITTDKIDLIKDMDMNIITIINSNEDWVAGFLAFIKNALDN